MSSIDPRLAALGTQRESEGVEVFREGLDLIRKLVSDKENIIIPPESFNLRGFVHDLFNEYKEFSVVRIRPGGVISADEAPEVREVTGRYYPAFIMYDAQGEPNQVVTIFVGDERKGVAVAKNHDNRSYVFVLSEPCDFKEGAFITLMTPDTPSGTYRVEKLLLLKEKPPKMEREYLFTDVNAVPFDFEDGVDVRVTWITSWATPSRVEYGPSTKYGQSVEDEDALNNHRVILVGLEMGRTYHYRLVGKTPDGEEAFSQDYTFTTLLKKRPEGRVEREIVTLYVRNDLPARSEKWPVTSGVPFPKGALSSPENVRVLNPAGEEVPVQASVLGEWPDGSIKWLLVDFQADVEPKGVAEYRLEFGRKVSRQKKEPKPRIVVTRKDSTVEMSTGPLRLLFNADEPSFPGRVWLDLNGDGAFSAEEEMTDTAALGGMELVDAAGKAYTSLKGACKVEVEEEGPLRTVIKVVGEHQAEDGNRLFTYVTRINTYAGKGFLKIFHTWENDYLDEDFVKIRSLVLKTPLRLSQPVCTLLGENAYRSTSSPTLSQNLDDDYAVEEGGIIKERGKRAKGLIDLSDEKWGLTVAVRDFWQNYPKSLAGDGNIVVVGICPPIPKDLYPPVAELEDKLYYYLLNGEYKLKQGVSKTHELLYYFHVGDVDEAHSMNYLAFLQKPLLAAAPSEWYCDSKAFGDVAMANRNKFPDYEENVNKAFEDYLKSREEGREYGMLNFGDWWGERGYDWGNMEYDTQHTFLLQFIRSGDLRFFRAGEEAARHYMDVDTCHYNRDKRRVGMVYAHCLCHVGDYYPDYYRKGAISRGVGDVSHTWTQGLLDYYFLTGYRRSLEVAKKIADMYNRYRTVNYDFTNCRVPGWHLILTIAVYQATGNEFYLNAAKIIVRRVLERQTPGVGGWLRQMMPGHCHCIPRHRGNAGFMVGILLSGLKLYHQTTGDEAVADSIVKGADFLIKDLWVPEVSGFRYTSCPKSPAVGADTRMLEGIAYAFRLSEKEIFRDVVLEAVKLAAKRGGFGKAISSQTRVAPHILYDIKNYMMEKG